MDSHDSLRILCTELDGQGALPWPVVALRICGAVLLSGCIGFEHEVRDRPAGLRTHMLVGLASSCFCLLTLELVARNFGSDVQMDPIRTIEAVTSGVAFLAAGMIVFSRGEIKGLTTGASLWLAAAVGVAAGLGIWLLAVLATVLALFIMHLLSRFERRMQKDDD